jgi:hypothetical protein
MPNSLNRAKCVGLVAMIAAGPCACCCRNDRYAELYVTSDPPLASVTDLMTGEYFGETPVSHIVTRADCSDRSMQLLITHPSCLPEVKNVTLAEWASDAQNVEMNGTRVHSRLDWKEEKYE